MGEVLPIRPPTQKLITRAITAEEKKFRYFSFLFIFSHIFILLISCSAYQALRTARAEARLVGKKKAKQ